MARRKTEGEGVVQLGAGPTKRGQRPALPISVALQAEIAEVASKAGVDAKAVAQRLSQHVEQTLKGNVARVYSEAITAALGLDIKPDAGAA